MSLEAQIRKLSTQPISYSMALSLLKGYSNLNDKLHRLVRDGLLQPLRRGLYTAGPAIDGGRPEPILLANHISGPSYVTAETALSYYGLIPERVFMVVSATTKTSRTYRTPAGVFSYYHLPLPYYSYGLRSVKLNEDQYAMMASPLKALFDKIIFTPRLTIRSRAKAALFLSEDLRMDEDALRNIKDIDIAGAASWLEGAPKRQSLQFIIEAI